MARPRLTVQLIVEQALVLIDRDTFDALSLSAVAGTLGVGPSALYTHVDGLEELQRQIALAATEHLVVAVRRAAIGTSGPRALVAMGRAYRRFALEHPGQFASTLLPPRLAGADADDALARRRRELLDVFIAVFEADGLGGRDAYLAARTANSAIHGFLAFEHNSGTTDEHGEEFEHLLGALQRGLFTTAETSSIGRSA